jgi:hypothetical protein
VAESYPAIAEDPGVNVSSEMRMLRKIIVGLAMVVIVIFGCFAYLPTIGYALKNLGLGGNEATIGESRVCAGVGWVILGSSRSFLFSLIFSRKGEYVYLARPNFPVTGTTEHAVVSPLPTSYKRPVKVRLVVPSWGNVIDVSNLQDPSHRQLVDESHRLLITTPANVTLDGITIVSALNQCPESIRPTKSE